MPNFMFYQGRKQARTKFSFSSNLSAIPKKSNSVKFACIRHFQGIAVNATEFEKKNANSFKSDVSAAVAVVDAKSRYYLILEALRETSI